MFFIVLSATLFAMAQGIDDKGINVALETILEFNGKERAADMQFLDKMQSFLKNVENTIERRNKKPVLRERKDKKKRRKHFTAAKLRKATKTTRVVDPAGLNFTDFFIHLVGVLRSFDKREVYLVFKTIEEEIKKRHDSECKVHELLENPTIRRSINKGLQTIKESPLQILEEIVNEFSLNPDRNGPFRIKDDVTKWSGKFFNWLNKFYTNNSPTSEQFFEIINSLDSYSNSKQSLRDNEIRNEIIHEEEQEISDLHDAEKLIEIVKAGLRSLFFDQYSNLDPSKRKVIQIQLQSYWMDPESDKDAVASGFDSANLGADGFLTSTTTDKVETHRTKKLHGRNHFTTAATVRWMRSTTRSSRSPDEKSISLYDDNHKPHKKKVKKNKKKSEGRHKNHKVTHDASEVSDDETTEKNTKKKGSKRKKKEKHVSKDGTLVEKINTNKSSILESIRDLLSMTPTSFSDEEVISKIKDLQRKENKEKESKSAEYIDWKKSLLSVLKRRSFKHRRSSYKKHNSEPQVRAKKRFKISNRDHEMRSTEDNEVKPANNDHSSKVFSISSSIEDSTSRPYQTQIIDLRRKGYRKHNTEEDSKQKTSKAWRGQVIEEHTATIDIIKKGLNNSSEEIIRFPKTKIKANARPDQKPIVHKNLVHNKTKNKAPDVVVPSTTPPITSTTVKLALAIDAEIERDEQKVVEILKEISKVHHLNDDRKDSKSKETVRNETLAKTADNKQEDVLSAESQALFRAVEDLGRTQTNEKLTKSPGEDLVDFLKNHLGNSTEVKEKT